MRPFIILIYAQIVFSSLHFLRNPSWPAAALFITSTGLFGFYLYLERFNASELDELRNELKALKSKVDGLSLLKGFGR